MSLCFCHLSPYVAELILTVALTFPSLAFCVYNGIEIAPAVKLNIY